MKNFTSGMNKSSILLYLCLLYLVLIANTILFYIKRYTCKTHEQLKSFFLSYLYTAKPVDNKHGCNFDYSNTS